MARVHLVAFAQISVHQIGLIFATNDNWEDSSLMFTVTYFQLDESFVFVVVLLHFVFFRCWIVVVRFFFVTGANILTDSTGQKVKLADFDTSIKLDNGYQQDNNPRGTEAFMAPEVNSICNYQ